MYLYSGYEPVPDASYIASYADETYRERYGDEYEEEEEDFGDAYIL